MSQDHTVVISTLLCLPIRGSTKCAYGDERARDVHARRFLRARNYVHVNQSKHFLSSTRMLFKEASCFCV